MFLVSLHTLGGFALRETPLAWGPRHWGQNCSPAVSAVVNDPSHGPLIVVATTTAAPNFIADWMGIGWIIGRSRYQGLKAWSVPLWHDVAAADDPDLSPARRG
jgi:hypothetical protein